VALRLEKKYYVGGMRLGQERLITMMGIGFTRSYAHR